MENVISDGLMAAGVPGVGGSEAHSNLARKTSEVASVICHGHRYFLFPFCLFPVTLKIPETNNTRLTDDPHVRTLPTHMHARELS